MALHHLSNLLLLLLCFRVQAIFDNHAEEFYLGFPPNQNFAKFIEKKLYLTTRESSSVNVTIVGNGTSENVIVEPGNVTEYTLKIFITVESSTDFYKGIHVQAEPGKKVAVSASSYHAGTAETFTVLPCHTYPSVSEYVYYAISSETELGNDMHSTLLLVGSSDGTRVTLTPTQSVTIPAQLTDGGVAVNVAQGSSYTFNLKRLQTFLIDHPRDLTGTKVVSNKPMAVMSSHQCARVPTTVAFCDFIVEQIPPTLTWGRQHLARSFASRSSDTHYQVIASNDETALNITCRNGSEHNEITTVKLSGGEVHSHVVVRNTTCSFISSKPVMVVQLSEGGLPEEFGDPLAMLITPTEQYVSDLSATIPVFAFSNGDSQRFLEIYSSVLDTSLQMNNKSLPLMEPVYSNSGIAGYVSTVPIPDEANYVTITSSGEVPYSVRYYGFSSHYDGAGHPSVVRLDPIAVPLVSIVNTTTTLNINESVGSVALPIVVSGDVESLTEVTVLQCNGSPLPSQYHVEPMTAIMVYGHGPVYKEIIIYTLEDDILEKKECLCLELSPTQNSDVFFSDNYQAELCFEDNEALTVELVRASVVENQVQMTFSASGYTGHVLVPLVFLPKIHYPDLAAMDQALPNFTMYYTFTPELTEITYSIEVNSEVLWAENIRLVVSLLTMDYNINFDQNSVILDNVTPPSPATNATEMPSTSPAERPTTLNSMPTSRTIATSAITMDDSESMFTIWVIVVCVLSVAIVCAVFAAVLCACLYFRLRYRTKWQVSEEPGTMLGKGHISFSEGSLSTHREDDKTVLDSGTQHPSLPCRNSYVVLNISTPSIPQSNGGLLGAVSQDSCRGSNDPLVSKPSSPTHSSTPV